MKRNLRIITILALLLLTFVTIFVLSSCGGENASGTTKDNKTTTAVTTVKVTTTVTTTTAVTTEAKVEKTEPESIVVGRVRVQLLSESLVRLEQAMSNGTFQDKPSFSVTNRTEWYKVDYTKTVEGENTVISTAKYKIYIPTAAKNLNSIYITDKDGEILWTYAAKTNSNVYLPSPSDELNSWYFCDNPRVIPSENGYSISEDGYEDNNGWKTDKAANDAFVFLPDGSYERFMKDFIELTGESEMVTLNVLGYWDSRYYEYNARTAISQIKEYQKRGYSIDILVIDTDWRDASNGVGYTINKKLFPDMAAFLEDAHELGVKIYFNDHPEPAKGTDSLLDEDEIEYRSENLTLLLSLGLDYWWYDRNWSVALKPLDSGISIYASGMYAFQWITEEYYESIVDDIDEYARRSLIMANVDGIMNGVLEYAPEIAAHKYTLQWTGDIGTLASDLDDEIYNLIYGGVELGLPYISSDLGGHTSEVSDSMYVRWLQYGALSTICRVHCTKPYSRMPWLYGDIAEAVAKQYVGMRYRLLPLFYQLSHENYITGLPVMRRLDINYPQYDEADRNDEYLLGDYILVAPINENVSETLPDGMLTSGDNKGLYVEYFKNKNLSGTPAYTGYDNSLNHDWQQSGPSEIGGLADNFSIRWTGNVTVGDTDLYLTFFADDGIKVWIDGELVVNGWTVYDTQFTSNLLKAGTTHTIKIEYCEYTSYAHIKVGIKYSAEDTRTVFIPDGTWIDVWTGKEYVGPTTITVSHDLYTSPIFVRSGAIVPLVKQASNTAEIDWSNISLDIYPSANYSAEAEIYEDDTETVAYKDGQYRTTDVNMEYDGEALEITVSPAKGSFDSELAVTERVFTIRLHDKEGFGKITKITVNGNTVTDSKVYCRSDDASPFMDTGATTDADVTEFSFKTDVTKKNVIKVYYESVENDETNKEYNQNSADFAVTVTEIKKNAMNGLNLTEEGGLDWALFGYSDPTSILRKKTGNGYIGTIDSDDTNYGFQDNYQIKWSDGDVKNSGSSTNGPVSRRNFKIVLKTDGTKLKYTLYIGGYKSISKITVRDRAGNAKTYTFGNMNTNYYRMITIECESELASEISINYSILCGDNITFSAVTLSKKED